MKLEFVRPEVESAYKCMFLPKSSKWVEKAKKLSTPGETVTIYEDKDIYYVTLLRKSPEKTYQFGIYTAQTVHLLSSEFVIHDGAPFYLDQETQNTVCILKIIKNLVTAWRRCSSIPDDFTYRIIKKDTIYYGDNTEVYLTRLDNGFLVLDAVTKFLKSYKSAEFNVLPQKA